MTAPVPSLRLVLLWHMHQPDYRDPLTREFILPWTYLHAIKDYVDMAAHLEAHPSMKAVVNWVPVLLDQLEDYAAQFAAGQVRDPLLGLLARENLDSLSKEQRRLVMDSCFRSNHHKMLDPFSSYKKLHQLFNEVERQGEEALVYLSGQYLGDLLTWYHLAWTGETVRREQQLVAQLIAKGSQFTYNERQALFRLIGELIQGIIPRYRRLMERGQVEISTTPHHHPLAPLLLDFAHAREAQPGAALPENATYPGGRDRVGYHLRSARVSHRRRFGADPMGLWPAEGGVCGTLLDMVADTGLSWTASGEGVLAGSLRSVGALPAERAHYLYRPYRWAGHPSLTLFFRDDRLSDLIGFEYAKWNGRDAAHHFIAELEGIARAAPPGEAPLVSVALDGENAWETYPYNGYYFLRELYGALERHPFIRTMTYREVLAETAEQPPASVLGKLVAGSWVYGNFSTWIGSPDKNRAWDLLCAAKQSFDLVMGGGRLTEEERRAAASHLATCESSDWFWWFGDYNPAHAVASFDALFRRNLEHLYRLLKLEPPSILGQPISHGHGDPEAGGAMRRAS